MLINQIRNNEINPNKYIKFSDAADQNDEPDDEASEVIQKDIRKQIAGANYNYKSKNNQPPMQIIPKRSCTDPTHLDQNLPIGSNHPWLSCHPKGSELVQVKVSYVYNVGAYPPQTNNTLIVNGNNYMNQDPKMNYMMQNNGKKPIRGLVAAANEIPASQKGNFIN